MAFNPRQSNMFRGSQNSNMKTPASVMKKQQQQKQVEHDSIIITEPEIIDCLQDLNIAFSLEDLRKPSPAKVQYLFENFVDMLMGVRKDSVEPMLRASSEELEFPEIQHDAALLMAFYRSLSQLMAECSIDNFSFNDLQKPEAGRLRVILSNVINFLRFREERWDVIQEHFQKAEKAKERIEQLYYENEELSKRLDNLKVQRKREEPAIKQANEYNNKMLEELRSLKKQQTSLTNASDELKSEKKGYTETLKNRTMQLQITTQECNNLRPYIVDSPDKLHQVITDMSNTLSTEKANVDVVERQNRALQTSTDSFGMVEQDVVSCLKVMEECEAELVKEEDTSQKAQRHQEILSKRKNETNEIERREQRLQRALQNANERLDRIREQGVAKTEVAKAEMARLGEEFERLSVERARTDKEMERKKLKIEQTEKKMADLRENIDKEIKAAHVEYERLSSHIQLYISEMEQSM